MKSKIKSSKFLTQPKKTNVQVVEVYLGSSNGKAKLKAKVQNRNKASDSLNFRSNSEGEIKYLSNEIKSSVESYRKKFGITSKWYTLFSNLFFL